MLTGDSPRLVHYISTRPTPSRCCTPMSPYQSSILPTRHGARSTPTDPTPSSFIPVYQHLHMWHQAETT